MHWRRRIRLLRRIGDPVAAAVGFVRMQSKVRLLGEVAVMVVEMGVALDRWVISTTIAVVVRVWSSPYLALLRRPGPLILVAKAVGLIASLSHPLLRLVRKHSPTLVRKVAVVASSTNVVMWVMAATLGPNLCADWRWSLIGCPSVGDRLLNRS